MLNAQQHSEHQGGMMSQPKWISTITRLPADGQAVLVKTRNGSVEHRVTFFAEPEPRWMSAYFITPVEMYAYWRPAPPARTRPTRDAHAAA
jgi:hypothetical protein